MKFKIEKERLLVCAALLGACTLGCYLRLRNLTADALWLDEVFSVATSNPDNDFLEVYRGTLVDVHPAFYQLALWAFYKVFSFGEMTGRYLSVAFGVLLIPVVYLSGRQLFSCRVGLLAAWLAAVNFYLITYSQETRSYELLALLTMASFLMYVYASRTLGLWHVAGYSLVAALLVNTHYYGFLVVASQAVLVIFKLLETHFDKRVLYRFGMAGGFILLSLAPQAPYIFANYHRQGFWIPSPNDRFFVDLFLLYFGNLTLAVVCAAMLLIAFARLMVEAESRHTLRLFVCWIAVCVVIPYVRSIYFQPVLTMRCLIILLPGILIVCAYALALVRDGLCRAVVLAVIMVLSMTPLFSEYKPGVTFENQLKPVSQMRDLVKQIIVEPLEAPLYSRQYIEFDQYFKLLGSAIEIRREENLERDLQFPHRPAVFYLLATRGIPLLNQAFMQRYDVVLLNERRLGDSVVVEYRTSLIDPKK